MVYTLILILLLLRACALPAFVSVKPISRYILNDSFTVLMCRNVFIDDVIIRYVYSIKHIDRLVFHPCVETNRQSSNIKTLAYLGL